jgi:DNA replication protein DnaC
LDGFNRQRWVPPAWGSGPGLRLVHEEYLAVVLSRKVAEREASGAATRIKAARFPAYKNLEEFNFEHQPSTDPNLIAHLGTGVFLSEAKNVVLLGPPGTGKPHLAVGIGIKAAKAGQRVLFDSATGWVGRLQEAHSGGKLAQELAKLRRYSHLIVDEVGYIPFDEDAANLFFQLVSRRYEHASLILASNLPLPGGATSSQDLTIASAMIDRIVHYADVISLKGNSYRLRKHQPAAGTAQQNHNPVALFSRRPYAAAVSVAVRPDSMTAETSVFCRRRVERARRGISAVASKNALRGHPGSSQKNRRVNQITSTGPATGMSRIRCRRRESRRVPMTPQAGQPDSVVLSALILRWPKPGISVSTTR